MKKKNMGKMELLVLVFLSVCGLALDVYTSIRTYHLFTLTLPPEYTYLAILSVCAFDIAFIAWFTVFLFASHGDTQKVISIIGMSISLLGMGVTFVSDTILSFNQNFSIKNNVQLLPVIVIITSAVIIVQVILIVLHWLTHPGIQKRAEQEKVRDSIHAESLASIQQASIELARHAGKYAASTFVNDMCRELGIPLLPSSDVNNNSQDNVQEQVNTVKKIPHPAVGGNGHVKNTSKQ